MSEININTDEILNKSKWIRFLFMALYAFALNILIPIIIGLSGIQFLFYLFNSKPNSSIKSFNSNLIEFFSDSIAFILFTTDNKPFPFKKDQNSKDEQIIDVEIDADNDLNHSSDDFKDARD